MNSTAHPNAPPVSVPSPYQKRKRVPPGGLVLTPKDPNAPDNGSFPLPKAEKSTS